MADHPPKLVFHIRPPQHGATLVAALGALLPRCSAGQLAEWVQQRRVLLNGNVCTRPHHTVRRGDVLKVLERALPPPVRASDIGVLYLDDHVLVIDKPPGINTLRYADEASAHRPQHQPTLVDLLPAVVARELGDLPAPRGAGRRQGRHGAAGGSRRSSGDAARLLAVHRLDRDTSGAMVFARTRAAQQRLIPQFRQHTTHRVYQAVVVGDLAEPRTIESYLADDRGDGRRGSTDDPRRGRRAVTHVVPLERLGQYTLVACRLETGRTHQIRIHLAEIGHMLCGEQQYTRTAVGQRMHDRSGAPRQALHAAELGFVHPASGEAVQFHAPWPDDLRDWLDALRARCAQRHEGS
jgi:23S rRNA pseudouridine1911/1915/1917 synthase